MDVNKQREISARYEKYYKKINHGELPENFESIVIDEIAAHYTETVFSDIDVLAYLTEEQPTIKDRIIGFFNKSARTYADDSNLSSAARKFARQYRKLFQQVAERDYQSNSAPALALSVENGEENPVTNINQEKMHDTGEERYSLVGRTEDGRGIYRSNYPENTPKDVKQKDIINLVQNVWSKKPIKLNLVVAGKAVPIEARFNPELTERSDLSKIAFGNRKGTASEKRITMNLSSDFYQIAEESHHVGSKTETGKDNAAHAGVSTWHYFLTDLVYVEADGTEIECYMNIDVKQNDSGHWFYSFGIEKGSRPADVLSVVTDKSATTSTNSIPENPKKSNSFSKKSLENSSEERFSLAEDTESIESKADYSYDTLVSKPNIEVVTLADTLPIKDDGSIDRKSIIKSGRENAKAQNNPKNTQTETYVKVKDINTDVIIRTDGLRHGLSHDSEDTAFATISIGDLLANSIAINESNARTQGKRTTQMSYVLLSVGQNKKGPYLVRIIVDKTTNEVSEISTYGLYAIKAKKDGVLFMPKGNEADGDNRSYPYLHSTISIADLLQNVKSINLANEVFSQDVADKLGVSRTKGTLSDNLRYSLPEDEDFESPTVENVAKQTEKDNSIKGRIKSFKKNFFTAKDRLYIDTVDEMYCIAEESRTNKPCGDKF